MKISAKHLCLLLCATFAVSQPAVAGTEAAPAAAAKPAPKPVNISGTVLETMDSGGYTYILLKSGDEKKWVAAPMMKVSVGQELTLLPGYEMKNFNSKGLNRKFDKIIFSGGIPNKKEMQLGSEALKMVHQGKPADGGKPQANSPAPAAAQAPLQAPKAQPGPQASAQGPVSMKQVKKAKGPNSYTVAQLYAKKLKLEKKPVVVRGQVVKVTPRVLKRNWVHIQDGSGNPAKNNNNLIVTTKELPRLGEVITVKGTLYNNMDFGSGYRYGVLVDARK